MLLSFHGTFPIFILKIVALENAGPRQTSKMAIKFWKKPSDYFDVTKECQTRFGHFLKTGLPGISEL